MTQRANLEVIVPTRDGMTIIKRSKSNETVRDEDIRSHNGALGRKTHIMQCNHLKMIPQKPSVMVYHASIANPNQFFRSGKQDKGSVFKTGFNVIDLWSNLKLVRTPV